MDRGVLAADCDRRPPARQIVLHLSAVDGPTLRNTTVGSSFFAGRGSPKVMPRHFSSMWVNLGLKNGLYSLARLYIR